MSLLLFYWIIIFEFYSYVIICALVRIEYYMVNNNIILRLTRVFTTRYSLFFYDRVKNCLDPDWVKTFTLDYQMGTNMNVVVKVMDEVSKGKNHEMGTASFDVNALFGAPGNVMVSAWLN